jgi:hypothetical protein
MNAFEIVFKSKLVMRMDDNAIMKMLWDLIDIINHLPGGVTGLTDMKRSKTSLKHFCYKTRLIRFILGGSDD